MTIPFQSRLIPRGDPAITPYTHDSVMTATPDFVFRPKTVAEIQELLAYCNRNAIPVTTSAARTSMTGSSVADRGVLLSMEHFTGITSVEGDRVRVGPGTILGEMQNHLEKLGFFYPPSPTSRHECTVGASIATNATGDTTYKYGTTRRYVRGLTVVLADGSLKSLRRINPPPPEFKNTAGYFLSGEEIDYFIGSEGTLGVIVEADLQILRGVPKYFTLFIPFPSQESALQFISHPSISPRTMEYIDTNALTIMQTARGFPPLAKDVRAIVICQQEFVGEALDMIEDWYAVLQTTYTQMGATEMQEGIIVAQSPADQDRIAMWRHHIPATISEQHTELQKSGGGKVGTDWWVPLARMPEMMAWVYAESEKLGTPYIAFGHLGNGHPHFNYLTRTADEKTRARNLVIASCKKAVSLGGGVAGEHGLGKLKRDLLALQYPPHIIDDMRALKAKYDPNTILAPGNIF